MTQYKPLLKKSKVGLVMKALRHDFRLCACTRCRGDAYLDTNDFTEWRCLQCGRTVPQPPGAPQAQATGLWGAELAIN